MESFLIIFFVLPFIILGVLMVNPSTAKGLIKLRNNLQGAKTNLTSASILMMRISGIFSILMGIFLLAFFLLAGPFRF